MTKDSFVFTPAYIGQPSSIVKDYTGEPFSGIDGHFVGIDGFIVPRDFPEFLDTHPDYILKWASRMLKQSRTHPDVQDWSQVLSMHLCQLPVGREVTEEETEEVRVVGGKFTQLGFTDVVNVFNPWAHFGASARRFYNYINRCLTNKFLSLISKSTKEALAHLGLFLDDYAENTNPASDSQGASREYMLMERSAVYNEAVNQSTLLTTQQLFLQQFKTYLEKRNPDLVRLMDAIMEKDRIEEILVDLDIDHNEFLRSRKKLVKISKAFTGGR